MNITNDCWLYRQGETMTKKPVVVEIDPNRISFESKTITKEDIDTYKANLLANQGVIKLKV